MAKEGDRVEIKTKEATYVGMIMPRSGLADKEHIILKLDNGYNIGLRKSEIVSEKLLKPETVPKETKPKIKIDKNLPQVSILSTGGTIASKIDYKTGGVVALTDADELMSSVPELQSLVNLKTKSVLNKMSEDLTPKAWGDIAEATAEELEKSDGVIITHGTDTMHYTSAALSFMLQGLNKPVVLTGAQRSSDRGSSDSFMNLICAAHVAKSDIAEVTLVMHGTSDDEYCLINRGTRVRKMHTSRRDAFRSINASPIGKVWPDGKIEAVGYNKRGTGKIALDTRFEEKTALLKTYPGSNGELLDSLIDAKFKGIVIEGTGLGHIPESWVNSIQRALDEGIAIVMTSQCLNGRVHAFVYAGSRRLSQAGVVYAEDMLPEVAYIKLGCVLGRGLNPKEEIPKNWAGEVSKRSGMEFLD